MKAERVALVAALVGGIGWCSKILIMWAQGGPDAESIPEALAFFAGLIGVTVAGGAVGWLLARDRTPGWLRYAALVLGAVAPLLVAGVVQAALGVAMPDAGWFSEEAAFLVVGGAAIFVGLWIAFQPAPSGQRAQG